MWMFIRANVILLMLLCVIVINISGRGCPKRSRDKIRSSNNEWAGIAAPMSLTATAFSSSEIRLSWQDNSNNEDGFEIERSIDGSNFQLLTSVGFDVTSFSDTELSPFTTYYYRVRAYNTIGDRSAYSNVVSAITIRSEWQAIAAGESHSIALNTNSSLWGWGNNFSGQLDPSNYAATFTLPTLLNPDTDWLVPDGIPLGIVSGTNLSTIAAGYYHTLSIKTNSTLWSWGDNTYGQLGLGNTDYPDSPTPVGMDYDWSAIAGGINHTIALKTGGTLWSWGQNDYGQLGLGYTTISTTGITTPTQIGTNSDWLFIASGGRHTIALKTDSTLWAWGWNYGFQLGDGTQESRTTPRSIGTASDWSKISASFTHTIALKTTGTLWQWGQSVTSSPTPTKIGTDTDWANITAGGTGEGIPPVNSYHSLALKINGSLWAWGKNTYGQLGLGDYNPRGAPTQLGTDSNWVAVAAGGYHSIARTNDGVLWVWGRNNLYQLGIGNTVNQFFPINTNLPQPGNLIATGITWTQITLSWSDNSSNAEQSGVPTTVGEMGFIIERSISPTTSYSLLATVSANTISYNDETVTRGNTYYYRVKATYPASGGTGDSGYSNVAVGLTILWIQQYTSVKPSVRYSHSMVWDPVEARVIMFGGHAGGNNYKNDLWWYDPTSGTTGAWIRMKTQGAVGSPSARGYHSMVWDGSRVIMFGGYDSSYNNKNDLWWYYAVTNTWIQQFTSITPLVRYSHSMVWDGSKVIMFGGFDSFYNYCKNDLWWYDPGLNTWTEMKTQGAPGSPSARRYHSMVWDGQRVIMFGGYDSSYNYKNDLWWYDPVDNTWTEQTPATSPSARRYHAMVWDEDGQRVIMFGGQDTYGYKNDLWWYDPQDNTWTEKIVQDAPGSPSVRCFHAMVWDSSTINGQRVIMFGGYAGTTYKNDLWWWW